MIKKFLILILVTLTMFTSVACQNNNNGDADDGIGEVPQTVEKSLPEIHFNFPNGAPLEKADGYVNGYVTLENCDDVWQFSDVPAKVKVRGNSTALADKKPYRIKFNKKQSMFGLNGGNKYKNWVLLADAYDYSMMRNYFIFNTGNLLDKIHSSDCMHVNVYIGNEYKGVYLLAEQNEVNEGRVDVDETNVETSVNTGYFIEADSRALDECVLFTSELSVSEIDVKADYCFQVKFKSSSTKLEEDSTQLFAVKSDISSDKEVAYNQLLKIQQYMQSVYTALFSYQGETQIRNLIDVESAVDMFIVNNIASLRGGQRSEYYYIDFSKEGDKLHFGPPWDYDLDCGNYDITDDPESFQALNVKTYVNYTLNQNAWFKELVCERWQSAEMYKKLNVLLKTVNPDDETAICNVYEKDFTANFTKWNVWGKKAINFLRDDVTSFTNHKDAVRYFYDWMKLHINYAESVWGNGTAK